MTASGSVTPVAFSGIGDWTTVEGGESLWKLVEYVELTSTLAMCSLSACWEWQLVHVMAGRPSDAVCTHAGDSAVLCSGPRRCGGSSLWSQLASCRAQNLARVETDMQDLLMSTLSCRRWPQVHCRIKFYLGMKIITATAAVHERLHEPIDHPAVAS